MLAAAAICAAVSLSFVAVHRITPSENVRQLFGTIFLIQSVVVVIGGSIYCLQSVQREKDQNTFDFQRITRQSPLRLALGKILGAPALTYFVLLCLMPVALWAAFVASVDVGTILQMYFVLLLGSVTFHCFAVLVSMVLERGTSAGAMFFFLWALGMTAIDGNSTYQPGPLAIHAIGPFWPYNLLELNGSSDVIGFPPPPPASPYVTGPTTDLFFGIAVPHAAVLVVLYVTLAAWFLLALARNIKRDPSVYEIYRPVQAFALALYLNFLVLGFLRWVVVSFVHQGAGLRLVSGRFARSAPGRPKPLFWFSALGIFVLSRADPAAEPRTSPPHPARVGRFFRRLGRRHLACSLSGPRRGPFRRSHDLHDSHRRQRPQLDWSFGLGRLQVGFAAAWLARDFIYLQWMNVRRTRRPLISGVLFLVVFYACTGVVLSTLKLFDRASAFVAAIFIPSAVFGMDAAALSEQQAKWIVALILLFAQALAFAWLQRRELKHLAALKPAAGPALP